MEATDNNDKLFGEEFLSEEDNNKSEVNYVDDNLAKKVDLNLAGLKAIIKRQADDEIGKEIKSRGDNSKRVAKLVRIAKLDKDEPALDIPKSVPLKKERGMKSTILANSEELEQYSYRDIMVERRKRAYLTALRRVGGNISKACARVGVSRPTIKLWMVKDEMFREEVMQLSEAIVDAVEDALYKKIKEGDTYAITFFLKTKGRYRGYTEKLDIEVAKDEFDKMTDQELLNEHNRLEAKIKSREGNT